MSAFEIKTMPVRYSGKLIDNTKIKLFLHYDDKNNSYNYELITDRENCGLIINYEDAVILSDLFEELEEYLRPEGDE